MPNRRNFIRASALVSLAPTLPTFLSNAAAIEPKENNGRILVVIQLTGGNDGINTVVPLKDEGYARHRAELRLPENDVIGLTDEFAFHPRLRSASDLFLAGSLSIAHGVGYPNPSRSHFESMEIWNTGSTDEKLRQAGNGWIGEAISMRSRSIGPHAIFVGDESLPVALRGRRCTAATIRNSADVRLRLNLADSLTSSKSLNSNSSLTEFITKSVHDAYVSAEELASATRIDRAARYPGSRLAGQLKLISQMIKSDTAARVFYTSHSGYDTHANQLPTHANLLGELSSSLKAFMEDLKQSGLDDRVLVMTFSEFGRRVKENASEGTDHGTAGPVLLAGTRLAQASFGETPKLTDLDGGDLKHTIDFRSIYSAVLSDWLELDIPPFIKEFNAPRLFNV